MPELSILQQVIAFLLLLTPVVFFHELGHYWAARRAGVVVEVFSVGFGKELFGWTSPKTGTRWRFAAIPLGGYVRMRGDENEASGAAPGADKVPGSFAGAPLGWRFIIVLAGPVANFILGIMLFAMVYVSVGKVFVPPQIGQVGPETAAAEAGLLSGDVVTDIDGVSVRSFDELLGLVSEAPGRDLEFTITRDGRERQLVVTPRSVFNEQLRVNIGDLGVGPHLPAKVGKVMADSAALEAGLAPGDLIVSVDRNPIDDFYQLRDIVAAAPDTALQFGVIRNGEGQSLTVIPLRRFSEEAQKDIGVIGVVVASLGERTPMSVSNAIIVATQDAFRMSLMILRGLGRLVKGEMQAGEVQGPVGIAEISGSVLQQGLVPFILFTALISINLGLVNLLPIPALDGGHLAFFTYEALFRRPLPMVLQGILLRGGIAILLSLTVFLVFFDLARRIG